MVFVDLEKAYVMVPRDLIWYCLRKSGVPEEYVCIIKDMYRDSTKSVVTTVGETEGEENNNWDYTKALHSVRSCLS